MIRVIENQTITDIAIQQDGTALSAFDWAVANGISITDKLFAGQQLIEPTSDYRNNDVAAYFKSRNKKIATHHIPETIEDYQLPGEFPLSF